MYGQFLDFGSQQHIALSAACFSELGQPERQFGALTSLDSLGIFLGKIKASNSSVRLWSEKTRCQIGFLFEAPVVG